MNAEFTLWGLGGAVVTRLILSFVKRIWLDDKGEPVIKDRWAILAAVVVSVVLSTAASLGRVYPAVQTLLDIVGAGLLAGLAACGIYDATKKR